MHRKTLLSPVYMAFAWALLCCSACHKTRECSMPYVKIPGQISFVGFQPDDLDTLYISSFRSGSGFSQFIKRDTLLPGNIILQHDTAFCNGGYPFFQIDNHADLEVFLPSISRIFRISAPGYHGDSILTWTSQYDACSTRGTPLWPPDSVTINGIRVPMAGSIGAYTIAYLHK
ncbi:MAG: hypothetical protein JST06_00935 [Bacteroidetes bacterium]|nr:hypothetical protein [Bacteroidota bacterium]